MPSIPLYQVDAFSDHPFAGNPAAVCPLDAPISEALMQDIAAENNLSETAFFHPAGSDAGGAFTLRWFTPAVEVDLCGHGTLASAFVLMTELEPHRREVTFHTKSGALVVRRAGDLFVLDFPLDRPQPVAPHVADAVSAALRVRATEVLRGRSFLAAIDGPDTLLRVEPDFTAIVRLGAGVCITAPSVAAEQATPAAGRAAPPIDFVSRYFAPAAGIPEDPVTGSSFCMLAPYWSSRLGKLHLSARQLSRRGGAVDCQVAGDRVLISGKACLVIRGTLTC
jgi:PhzF family phenazine biosynthesis protein